MRLREFPEALQPRLRSYLKTHHLDLRDGVVRLVTLALDTLDARSSGGKTVHTRRTPEERAAYARRIIAVRWGTRPADASEPAESTADGQANKQRNTTGK